MTGPFQADGRWKWVGRVAVGAAAALVLAWSKYRPRTVHAVLDRSIDDRCPRCQVAIGHSHLASCAYEGRWQGQPHGPDDTEQKPPGRG